jgi:hypothetical protein
MSFFHTNLSFKIKMLIRQILLSMLIITMSFTSNGKNAMAHKTNKAKTKQANTNKTTNNEPPLTEAERALDIILKVQNGLITNSKLKHKDMFTKAFDESFKRQSEYVANNHSGYCLDGVDDDGNECSFATMIHDTALARSGDPDPYYYASKTTPKGKLSRRTKCGPNGDKCIIVTKAGAYWMKKENGKWKIDCFHAGMHDPDVAVNAGGTEGYPRLSTLPPLI